MIIINKISNVSFGHNKVAVVEYKREVGEGEDSECKGYQRQCQTNNAIAICEILYYVEEIITRCQLALCHAAAPGVVDLLHTVYWAVLSSRLPSSQE